MNAMDIKPRPKLIVTIMKSMSHAGATQYTDSSVDPKDLFSNHLYIAEKGPNDYAATERRMAMFLKVSARQQCVIVIYYTSHNFKTAFRSICCPYASRQTRSSSCTTTLVQCLKLLAISVTQNGKNETVFCPSRFSQLLVPTL